MTLALNPMVSPPARYTKSGRRMAIKEWSDDMVAFLATMWVDGLSANECSNEFAKAYPDWPGKFTRNVIIGQVNRNRAKGLPEFEKRERATGLKVHPKHRRAGGRGRTRRSAGYGRSKQSTIVPKVNAIAGGYQLTVEPIAPYVPLAKAFDAYADSQPKSFADLAFSGECRWPVDNVEGATSQMFCARDCKGTYCTRHSGR